MRKPLAIDLFCGCFGWSAGWLELGGYVVGFDLEHLPHHGPVPQGADLVLQDVRTLHGSQFKRASLILCSPPCQEYSYMAMPWTRAKEKSPPVPRASRDTTQLRELFDTCFRLQREASEAAGHHIPMIVENVRGAQPWVGKAAWHYGSYYLWGDVPALMPVTHKGVKVGGIKLSEVGFNVQACRNLKAEGGDTLGDGATKNNGGGGWFAIGNAKNKSCPDGRRHTRNLTPLGNGIIVPETVTNQNPVHDGVKLGSAGGRSDQTKIGSDWTMQHAAIAIDEHAGTKGYAARLGQSTISRRHGSKSTARKAASARIAKIPLPLARHIAQTFLP